MKAVWHLMAGAEFINEIISDLWLKIGEFSRIIFFCMKGK